jgi:phage gp37-like protein
MSLREDWLSVGAQIVERLQGELAGELRQVRLAAAIEEIGDASPASPAVWVAWGGDRIVEGAGPGQGAAQAIDQTWIVALLVRSAKEAASGAGAAEKAGPLIARILAALMGWQPDGSRALRRVEAPRPTYAAGTGVYPLAFAARLIPTNV